MSKITAKPAAKSPAEIEAFINGAPDAKSKAPAAPAPVPAARVEVFEPSGGRKKPISLTIDASILTELDKCARGLGLSRAGAFSLAVSRFIAQEKKDA